MTRPSTPSSLSTPRTRKRPARGILLLVGSAAGALLMLRNGEAWLRSIILYLSRARWARRIVTGFGPAWAAASRFVAGESVDEAIATSRRLNSEGLAVALDYLGESVESAREASDARDQILLLIDRIAEAGVNAYVSVKLSQLGLKLDENLALQNLRLLLERAQATGCRVRIDMEESALVDITLDIYRRLRDDEGYSNVGVVIQSCLYRSEEDVKRLVAEGAWVRLVKGAYKEPASVAYPDKRDTDAAYLRLTQMMLRPQAQSTGAEVAAATHDAALIAKICAYVESHPEAAGGLEFQMLYGIRRELQRSLAAQGWAVRVYVPYGTAWYPYFMRRLAERPANVWFFISNFFRA